MKFSGHNCFDSVPASIFIDNANYIITVKRFGFFESGMLLPMKFYLGMFCRIWFVGNRYCLHATW